MSDLDILVDSCRYLLNNSPEAQEHLEYLDSRLPKDKQEEFSFGFFPGAKNLNLLTAFVSLSKLKEMKLLYTKDTTDSVSPRNINVLFFENHQLILPYKDVYGNVVGLIGRTLLGDDERKQQQIPSKYKNTDFIKGNHVFGLYEAKADILKKDFVYIVEGQFDVIKAREKGIRNIVAIGNSNISAYQISLICRYTKNIFLLLDNDAAGEKGREIAIKKFGQICNINSVYLPFGYKDIDEYLKNNNGDSLQFIVKNTKYYL